MIPKPAMWRVAEGWNQNIGCAYILNPYFSVWKPERCFGAFKTPESLKEPRFLGNGCYREQKAKLPPIHRRSWRHWAFVFRFLAVNIIWPKLSVVCIMLSYLVEYHEHAHTLRFVPGPLCPVCPIIYFKILHSNHHKQWYFFRGVWRKDSLSGNVLCHTNGHNVTARTFP